MAAPTPPLKQLFTKFCDFVPTRELARQINIWRIKYETRDSHAEALNTPLLGVFKIKFMPKDSQALFDILGVDRSSMQEAIKSSTVNKNFIVASDSYNQLIVWAAHKFFNSNLPLSVREQACTDLFFMLLCKFFSGLVGHWLPYGANPEIMEATINGLSDKFDIKHKETCTWKLIMLARAAELLNSSNIHFKTLKTFLPDEKVTYIITDTETRIRTKIRLIIQEYHETRKQGKTIKDTTLIGEDLEGEKIVKELKSNFDTMITSVTNKVMNLNQFIKADFIAISCKMAANVKPDMMRALLMKFCVLSTYQYQKHKQDEIDKAGIYRGYYVLIKNVIQATYRACIMDKQVKLNSKLSILNKAVNLYKSSRISDPAVLAVKSSVDAFVIESKISSREATNASLKIAFILYLILMTFDVD